MSSIMRWRNGLIVRELVVMENSFQIEGTPQSQKAVLILSAGYLSVAERDAGCRKYRDSDFVHDAVTAS
jgi:hypothetical protein